MQGCSKEQAPMPAKAATEVVVTLDLDTPDKALKSYWAVRDSVEAKRADLFAQDLTRYRAAEVQIAAVTEGSLGKEFAANVGAVETFARDIIDLKVESESRAVVVVVIKNTTTIPAGAEMTKYHEEQRRDGERYRYVLEKSQGGWRVAEIWEWSGYPSKDWKKVKPRDGKPQVPSLTYLGI